MAQALRQSSVEVRSTHWSAPVFSDHTGPMAAIARHYVAPASRVVFTRQHLFDQLCLEWHEGTQFSSSLTEIVAHPSYQRIIGMGRDALPYIFASLRREADHWHSALLAITGVNPVAAQDRGNLTLVRDAWLQWAANNQAEF